MNMNRRQFVGGVALTAFGCIGGCQSSSSDATASQSGNPVDAEAHQVGTVDIGVPSDFPKDGAYDKFIASDRMIVVRRGATVSAVSAICTHRGANCQSHGGGESIVCAKHGSRFGLDGKVTKGPADDDLPCYAIAKGPNGRLVVDKGRKLKASDAGASVTV